MSDIIEKIRKLRALATSDNVNEAAAAAAAAERLIQEHNISEAQFHVETADDAPTWETLEYARSETWLSVLRHGLSRAYQCRGIYLGSNYQVFGRREDIETFKYQLAFFALEITRLCKRHSRGKGRAWANSFRIGAAQAVVEALKATNEAVRSVATSTALAVVDGRAMRAEQALRHQYPNTHKKRAGQPTSQEGMNAGRKAGAGLNQRSQLGANGVRMLT